MSGPVLSDALRSVWPEEKLNAGMNKEMKSIKDYKVYEEVSAEGWTPAELRKVIKTRWVLVWKGDEVKARLVAKGYSQDVTDYDTYASTPLLCSLKILLLVAQTRKLEILFADVSTAFLHAELQSDEIIYVEPPTEYYPKGSHKVVWKLRKALYGLKTAPKQWQQHLCNVLTTMKGQGMKSEPNIYYFRKSRTYMLVYVDDLVIVGDQPHKLFDELAKKVKLKKTGLLTEGVTVKFLGRKLRMLNGIIEL